MTENEAIDTPEVPESTETKDPKRRNIIIVIAVIAVVLFCCCSVVAAFFAIDPFDWNVLSRLFGKADPVAEAMPEDTGVYMGINFLNATPAKLDRVISSFQDAVEEMSGEKISTSQDLVDELDRMLDEELNLSLEEDIMSWIGQYAGIGLTNLQFGDYGDIEDPNFVIAIEVRNKKAADEFLLKLEEGISENTGSDFDIDEYDRVEIYELNTDYDYDRVAFARSGNLFLLAQDKNTIKDAIDAQNDISLGDDDVYQDLTKEMPGERALTVYVTGRQLQDLTKGANTLSMGMVGMGTGLMDVYDSVQGVMLSAAITSDGLQFDTAVAYDLDNVSDTQMEILKNSKGKGKSTSMFPEETLVYGKGARIDLIWEYYREFIIEMAGPEEYDEMMAELEDEIGFDVENDLIPYLNGELAFGVFESSEGILVSTMNVDLGLGFLVEVSDEDAVMSVVNQFASAAEDQGVSFEETSSDKVTMYEVSDDFMGETILAFGLGKDYLGVASSSSDLENLYFGDSSLSKNDEFKQVWKSFPKSINPSFYMDVQTLIEVIRGGLTGYSLDDFEEVAPIFEPIQYIAAGASSLERNVMHNLVVIFLP
jgi:hypothetical protein